MWAVLGSNQRPLPCQGSALPLRQPPVFVLLLEASREMHSEVTTGFEPVYTALQAVASPLGHVTAYESQPVRLSFERMTRFELATLTLAR